MLSEGSDETVLIGLALTREPSNGKAIESEPDLIAESGSDKAMAVDPKGGELESNV